MKKDNKEHQKVVLVIIEGWGVAPESRGNAISLAKTPNFDNLVKIYPVGVMRASGEAVGLSKSQTGDAVVGHLNIGAGRVVYQKTAEIDRAILSGDFFNNSALIKAVSAGSKHRSNLHIVSCLSGKNIEYLVAILELIRINKVSDVFFHIVLGGGGSYNEGLNLVAEFESKLEKSGVGSILTVSGRDYTMDSGNHWDMIEQSYRAIVEGQSDEIYQTASEAIRMSYNNQIFDDQMKPVVIEQKRNSKLKNYDSIVFLSCEAERMREFVKALSLPSFSKFNREYLNKLLITTMIEYDYDLPVAVAFKTKEIKNTLSEIISINGLEQIKIAETERYPHLTFFFSGQNEQFEGEIRKLIPAQKTRSYDESPFMSLKEIVSETTKAIMTDQYALTIVNIANPDLVAHSGNIKATVKSIEVVDNAIGKISDLVLAKGDALVVVSSHGNAEEMINLQSGELDKDHNIYPVPFIVVGAKWEGMVLGKLDIPGTDLSLLKPIGELADVAPTILSIMGLQKPKEMTGKSLI